MVFSITSEPEVVGESSSSFQSRPTLSNAVASSVFQPEGRRELTEASSPSPSRATMRAPSAEKPAANDSSASSVTSRLTSGSRRTFATPRSPETSGARLADNASPKIPPSPLPRPVAPLRRLSFVTVDRSIRSPRNSGHPLRAASIDTTSAAGGTNLRTAHEQTPDGRSPSAPSFSHSSIVSAAIATVRSSDGS